MIQWEYFRTLYNELADLAPYGKEGWEVCVIDPKGNVIFKRPLPPDYTFLKGPFLTEMNEG